MKSKSRVAIAKDFQRKIAKLSSERNKVYDKALRELKVVDDYFAYDYFMRDQQGYSGFIEAMKREDA